MQKIQFIKAYIETTKASYELDEKFSQFFNGVSRENTVVEISNEVVRPFENLAVEVLTKDEHSWIDWYCFETNFGRNQDLTYTINDDVEHTPTEDVVQFIKAVFNDWASDIK